MVDVGATLRYEFADGAFGVGAFQFFGGHQPHIDQLFFLRAGRTGRIQKALNQRYLPGRHCRMSMGLPLFMLPMRLGILLDRGKASHWPSRIPSVRAASST